MKEIRKLGNGENLALLRDAQDGKVKDLPLYGHRVEKMFRESAPQLDDNAIAHANALFRSHLDT